MSEHRKKYRAQRKRLWQEQDRRCFWCGTLTVLPPDGAPKRFIPQDDTATTDHLDSRLSPERGKHPGELRRVMACYKCNQERCNAEVLASDLAERQRKSGRLPRAEPRSGPAHRLVYSTQNRHDDP